MSILAHTNYTDWSSLIFEARRKTKIIFFHISRQTWQGWSLLCGKLKKVFLSSLSLLMESLGGDYPYQRSRRPCQLPAVHNISNENWNLFSHFSRLFFVGLFLRDCRLSATIFFVSSFHFHHFNVFSICYFSFYLISLLNLFFKSSSLFLGFRKKKF